VSPLPVVQSYFTDSLGWDCAGEGVLSKIEEKEYIRA